MAHFDETLGVLHELLEQDGLIAHELDRPQRPSELCKLPPGIYVVRASLLEVDADNKVPTSNTALKIIAIEPHLMPESDPALRKVLDQVRGDVLYEHHASLDDLTLRLFAGEGTMALLSRAGFNEDDCLSSGMVSRAINHAQARLCSDSEIDPSETNLTRLEAKLLGD